MEVIGQSEQSILVQASLLMERKHTNILYVKNNHTEDMNVERYFCFKQSKHLRAA